MSVIRKMKKKSSEHAVQGSYLAYRNHFLSQ